jgi:cation:H+ antiporter
MFAGLSTPLLLIVFAAGGVVILLAGLRMTHLADQIADRTGWGEAVVGGALLGGATSLSGITVSVTAAAAGDPSLAFSNAVGGIAAQTAFLAFGDIFYRKVNLEHAAAEPANLFQATLLAMMMSLAALAAFGPELSFLGVHPASVFLALGYGIGLVTTARVKERPM